MSRPKNPKSGAGPGRGESRRVGRRLHAVAEPKVTRPEDEESSAASPRRRLGVTRRALALVVVIVILGLSYMNSLRIYFETERQQAADRWRIQQSQQRIDELDAELERWNDPDHVTAQARSRLGWVVPGDTSYRVIGADGKVLGVDDTPGTQPPPEDLGPWYGRMIDSVRLADQPPTLEPEAEENRPDPADREPITTGEN